MSRSSRLISAVAVTLLLAACGQDMADNPLGPDGRLENGVVATGGNNSEDGSGTGDTSVQSDTTGRGITATGGN